MTIHQDVENNDIEAVKAKIAKYKIALENFKNSDYKEKNFVKRAWQRYMGEFPTNPVNQYDQTDKPLLALVKTPAMAQLLIDAGADVNSSVRMVSTIVYLYLPILSYFVNNPEIENKVEIVKVLLNNGADINLKSTYIPYTIDKVTQGSKAIHLASDIEIIKLLISVGADIDEKNSAGKTLSDIAMPGRIVPLPIFNYTKILSFLIENEAEVNEKNLSDFLQDLSNTVLMYLGHNFEDYKIRYECLLYQYAEENPNMQESFWDKMNKICHAIAEEDISLIESSILKRAEKVKSKLEFNKAITPLLKKTAKDIYSKFQEKHNIPAEIFDKIIIHMNDDVNLTELEKYKQIDHANSKILDGKKELSDKTISQKSKENIYLKSLKDYTFAERLKNATSNDVNHIRG